jgi:predicted RNA-binding protein YlxR (DUF448 family)|tara:strand:- start:3141 stop:3890 length:750 start_codon:yes stop_codon:yes gene_type:complete
MHQMARKENNRNLLNSIKDGGQFHRCILSGDKLLREELVRFILGPDNTVFPDVTGRAQGQGYWLTGRHDMIVKACEKNVFQDVFEKSVTPMTGPEGQTLADIVDVQLSRRCLEAIGLARKANNLKIGFDKVYKTLRNLSEKSNAGASGQRPSIVLTSIDASENGQAKINALGRHLVKAGIDIVQLRLFNSTVMGKAVGRERIVYTFFEKRGTSVQLYNAAIKLATYRGITDQIGFRSSEINFSNGASAD